jgi:hypothetical protein
MAINLSHDVEADFRAAREFLGKEWLEKKHTEFYERKAGTHLRGESPPELITSYHAAKATFGSTKTQHLDIGDFNESGVKFLNIGRCVNLLSDTKIIDMDGTEIDNDLCQLYRSDLQNSGQHPWDFIYELQIASLFVKQGYEVAFIDESETSEASPEFRLTGCEPQIDVECKRVRTSSGEEAKEQNRINRLLINTVDQFDQNLIAYYELNEVPSWDTISDFKKDLGDITDLSSLATIDLEFGKLHLRMVPADFPYLIYQEVVNRCGLINAAYTLLVRPTLKTELGLDIGLFEHGDFQVHLPTRSAFHGQMIGSIMWVGTDYEISHDDAINRVKKQIKRTSGKFSDDRAALVYVDIPNASQLSKRANLDLRHKIKGELKLRSVINAVVCTSQEMNTSDTGSMQISQYSIPNYFPNNELPDGFQPLGIDLDSAKTVHQIHDDALDEDLTIMGSEGLRKILDQDEWGTDFKTGSGTFFESPILKLSESNKTALYLGPDDTGRGTIDLISITNGIFRIPVPDRIRGTGICHVVITFDGVEFAALIGPDDDDSEKFHAIRVNPIVRPRDVDEDVINDLVDRVD